MEEEKHAEKPLVLEKIRVVHKTVRPKQAIFQVKLLMRLGSYKSWGVVGKIFPKRSYETPEAVCVCQNCDNEFLGNYCNVCGQPRRTRRLSFSTWIGNFAYAFTNMDQGFFFSLIMMILRPGVMIRDYLECRRASYIRPLSMLVILGAVFGVLTTTMQFSFKQTLNPIIAIEETIEEEITEKETEDTAPTSVFEENEVITGNQSFDDSIKKIVENATKDADNNKDVNPAQEKGQSFGSQIVDELFPNPTTREIVKMLFDAIANNVVYWALLLIPICMFWAKIVFRKSGARRYNYVEMLYVGTIIACQYLVFSTLLIPYVWIAMKGKWSDVSEYVILGYLFLAALSFKQLFRIKWWKAFRKTIWVFLLVFPFLLIFVIVVLVAIMYFTHPEVFNS